MKYFQEVTKEKVLTFCDHSIASSISLFKVVAFSTSLPSSTTLLLTGMMLSVSSMESSCLTLVSRFVISRYTFFNWRAKILFSVRS
jgi:hypothetical protein